MRRLYSFAEESRPALCPVFLGVVLATSTAGAQSANPPAPAITNNNGAPPPTLSTCDPAAACSERDACTSAKRICETDKKTCETDKKTCETDRDLARSEAKSLEETLNKCLSTLQQTNKKLGDSVSELATAAKKQVQDEAALADYQAKVRDSEMKEVELTQTIAKQSADLISIQSILKRLSKQKKRVSEELGGKSDELKEWQTAFDELDRYSREKEGELQILKQRDDEARSQTPLTPPPESDQSNTATVRSANARIDAEAAAFGVVDQVTLVIVFALTGLLVVLGYLGTRRLYTALGTRHRDVRYAYPLYDAALQQFARHEAISALAPMVLAVFFALSLLFIILIGAAALRNQVDFENIIRQTWPIGGLLFSPIIATIPVYFRVERKLKEDIERLSQFIPAWVYESPGPARMVFIQDLHHHLVQRMDEFIRNQRNSGDSLNQRTWGASLGVQVSDWKKSLHLEVRSAAQLEAKIRDLVPKMRESSLGAIHENWEAARAASLEILSAAERTVLGAEVPTPAKPAYKGLGKAAPTKPPAESPPG